MGEFVTSNPRELNTLNCISAVLMPIESITLRDGSSNFSLSSTPSKGVFLTKAYFQ